MKDICKMPRNKLFFEILRLHYLKFQIPVVKGLSYLTRTQTKGANPPDPPYGTFTYQTRTRTQGASPPDPRMVP